MGFIDAIALEYQTAPVATVAALVSVAGATMSIVALPVALCQLHRTKTAAEAAGDAVRATASALRDRIHLIDARTGEVVPSDL